VHRVVCSHDDVSACARLLTQLKPVERKYGLSLWHDERLKAGHHWNLEIEAAIGRADVFILLVSPEFVGSDYIFDTELPAIKRRLRVCKGEAISVVVRDCDWEFACGPTQAVPSIERRLLPIEDWKPHNKGYNACRRAFLRCQIFAGNAMALHKLRFDSAKPSRTFCAHGV
jgi:hypothetical protein